MLQGHDIVCFANDWHSDPTSKKHVMQRLARANRVLWVNSIGCRNPTASPRDLRRMASKLVDFCRGCRQVAPNVWTFSPLVVPFHGNPLARRLNRRLLAASLRLALRRLGMHDVLTWTFVPSSADVVGTLGERLVVYHCVDEFSRFTGVDTEAFLALEAKLAARADVVFVSAERLFEAKLPYNPRTFLIRHGVEVEHFGRALDPSTPVPADLGAGDGRPVIGFFGLIADWVDLELVAHLARARPEWRLVLIGKADCDLAPLAGLANVSVLGWRSYGELPAYCRGFDAAILPFRINELTLAANPLKLREYLAAGLPVVSTAIPEAERLAPLVRVGRTPDEFLAELEAALGPGERGPQAHRAAAMARESWDHKTEELSGVVTGFLGEASRRARQPAVGGVAVAGGGGR